MCYARANTSNGRLARPAAAYSIKPRGFSHRASRWVAIDLLHALKDVESHHGMSASGEAFEVPTRTQGEPAAHRGNSRFFPRYRAVARSMRPRRNPCHRRANHHWFASPCGSGTASHRFRSALCYTGPHQNVFDGTSNSAYIRGLWPLCPLNPHLFSPRFRQVSEHSSLTGRRGYALVSPS